MIRYISPEMILESFETADVITVSELVLALPTDMPADNETMTVTYDDLWIKQ